MSVPSNVASSQNSRVSRDFLGFGYRAPLMTWIITTTTYDNHPRNFVIAYMNERGMICHANGMRSGSHVIYRDTMHVFV